MKFNPFPSYFGRVSSWNKPCIGCTSRPWATRGYSLLYALEKRWIHFKISFIKKGGAVFRAFMIIIKHPRPSLISSAEHQNSCRLQMKQSIVKIRIYRIWHFALMHRQNCNEVPCFVIFLIEAIHFRNVSIDKSECRNCTRIFQTALIMFNTITSWNDKETIFITTKRRMLLLVYLRSDALFTSF